MPLFCSTYSFININASIDGPGGTYPLGYGNGTAEEGITIAMVEDKNNMAIGSDGSVMHSLHAGNGGTITIRYLKTAPTNYNLNQMLDFQRISSANWGRNIIVISDPTRGDQITCLYCAFKRWPNVTYAKDGGMQEWAFDAGQIDGLLGIGSPEVMAALAA